jgi:hypothetical protein
MEDVSQNLVQGLFHRSGLLKGIGPNAPNRDARVKLIRDGKHFAYLILAASAIGQGSRMLYQGILAPGSSYIPSGIDLAFDWGILLTFGVFVLIDQLIKGHKGVVA